MLGLKSNIKSPSTLFLIILTILYVQTEAWLKKITVPSSLNLIFVLLSALTLYLSWKEFQLIRAIPKSKIRSLSIGRAEISGIAEKFDKIKIAPYSKKECFAWRVQKIRKRNKNSLEIIGSTEKEDGYFYLNDGTGKVLINTEGADFDITPNTFDIGNFTIWEKIIEPGKKYYIIGEVKDNPFVKEASSTKNCEDLMIGSGDVFIIAEGESRVLITYFAISIFSFISFILSFLALV